jgi:hypothetical protein
VLARPSVFCYFDALARPLRAVLPLPHSPPLPQRGKTEKASPRAFPRVHPGIAIAESLAPPLAAGMLLCAPCPPWSSSSSRLLFFHVTSRLARSLGSYICRPTLCPLPRPTSVSPSLSLHFFSLLITPIRRRLAMDTDEQKITKDHRRSVLLLLLVLLLVLLVLLPYRLTRS